MFNCCPMLYRDYTNFNSVVASMYLYKNDALIVYTSILARRRWRVQSPGVASEHFGILI